MRRRLLFISAAALLVAWGLVAYFVWIAPEPRSEDGVRSFVTRPDLYPPAVRVRVRPGEAGGAIVLGPKVGPGQAGPMILDRRGRMVWFRAMKGRALAFDVRVQRYRGKPVLTWFQGRVREGHGEGVDVIVDRSYREVARVRAKHGQRADLHEFVLTKRGTALITVYRTIPRDLSRIGGPVDGHVVEGVIQAIDVRTGKLRWEWHSLDHVGLGESYGDPATDTPAFDYFHVNSIQVLPDRNLLISARNTDTVYKIDRRTGKVIWRLGGKRSDFRMGPGTRFLGQHTAQRLPDGTIAIFDNGFPPLPGRESRVIELRLDRRARTARLVRAIHHPESPHAHSQGGEQLLRNGDLFVGWGGGNPFFTEHAPDGRIVLDGRFVPDDTTSYRAYRAHWAGRPATRPRMVGDRLRRGMRAYMSWNGATRVRSWRVLGGADQRSLRPLRTVPWTDFETSTRFDRATAFVRAEALDRAGRVLRRSAVVRVTG